MLEATWKFQGNLTSSRRLPDLNVFDASNASSGQTRSATKTRASCSLEPFSVVVQKRTRRWLGYVLTTEADSMQRVALRWTPQGKRSRGRPKVTWRRAMEKELWSVASHARNSKCRRQAEDQQQLRTLTEALCATRRSGSWRKGKRRMHAFAQLFHLHIFLRLSKQSRNHFLSKFRLSFQGSPTKTKEHEQYKNYKDHRFKNGN